MRDKGCMVHESHQRGDPKSIPSYSGCNTLCFDDLQTIIPSPFTLKKFIPPSQQMGSSGVVDSNFRSCRPQACATPKDLAAKGALSGDRHLGNAANTNALFSGNVASIFTTIGNLKIGSDPS